VTTRLCIVCAGQTTEMADAKGGGRCQGRGGVGGLNGAVGWGVVTSHCRHVCLCVQDGVSGENGDGCSTSHLRLTAGLHSLLTAYILIMTLFSREEATASKQNLQGSSAAVSCCKHRLKVHRLKVHAGLQQQPSSSSSSSSSSRALLKAATSWPPSAGTSAWCHHAMMARDILHHCQEGSNQSLAAAMSTMVQNALCREDQRKAQMAKKKPDSAKHPT